MVASTALVAQSTSAPQDLQVPANSRTATTMPRTVHKGKKHIDPPKPFSRIALGGGISAMGVNMQAAINANRYINLRGTGNYFTYSVDNISTNGFNVNGKLNLATAGVAVDFYPFPNHGFRISPGALFYNQNAVTATMIVQPGTTLTLNNVDYTSPASDPIKGYGSVGLNTNKQAFTITTGWGNMISRKGGHLSFPFEIGAAMIGKPTVDVALTSGLACDPSGLGCVTVNDPSVQSNLKAQINKYTSDLDPLRFYPIISFGVAYNFKIR